MRKRGRGREREEGKKEWGKGKREGWREEGRDGWREGERVGRRGEGRREKPECNSPWHPIIPC